ncbi:MAG: LuxR C-terminal-related transcriptional regulator [Chloroflexi bacterium]|nr:LuxR C-terminal-related transcriptional regulator [Chloroflexota bacterium]
MSTAGIVALLSAADFGVYAMSLDQRIVFWNRGAERILGYAANEVVGRHCYEVVAGVAPGGLTPACLNGCPSMRSLQDGRVPSAARLEMLCASGERKSVSVTPIVVSGVVGDAPLLVHLFEDREERGRADAALDEVRKEFSQSGVDMVSDQPLMIPASAASTTLTGRELEVLHLVALGRGTADIATELGISQHTVRNHVRHFRSKLNASTKLEAVITALRRGILEWPDGPGNPPPGT